MLEIKNLTKIYGNKKAVDNLSLTIEDGDLFGFIGHNGAGKSTTIKSIVGIINFDDGDILLDGVSIKSDPLYLKSLQSYVPDNPDLYDSLKAIDYLNFIADVFYVSESYRMEVINKYSNMFGINNELSNFISTYSHGMKQKLAIISALLHKSKMMILDEPFVGLDPIAIKNVKDIMKEYCSNGGIIFFSTHVLEVAEKLCNKVAIIKDGKLLKSGLMEDIVKDKSLEDVFVEMSKNA